MDGPIEGTPEAWSRLAALNPLQRPASTPAASSASASAADGGCEAFVLLRPEAVRRALVSEICQRFERRGLSLAAMRMLKPGSELAARHYADAAPTKAAMAALVEGLAPGPALATLWRGPGAIAAARAIAGDDDALRAAPGTVRGDLCAGDQPDALVEVPSAPTEVSRLCGVWFEPSDLAASAASLASAPAPAPVSAPAAAPAPAKSAKSAKQAKQVKAPATATGKAAPAPALGVRPTPVEGLGQFYITTAINYANGAPHMGHAYEAIAADVIARYHRCYGREVYFLTGADEHGQKIADAAEKAGVKPIELCDKHVALFKKLDATLGVEFDGYVRTTSDAHKRLSRRLWERCVKAGGVYLGVYTGWYSVREETFITETEAAASDYKDPMSGAPLKKMEEPSYFFKLSEYQSRLIAHIKAHPEFIVPEARRNEVLERLAVPLQDLSVSRTTFDWGIAVPGDVPGHVMYVWFDALSNYISAIGYDALADDPSKAAPLAKFWPADVHLIGKDIIWFHCVIWPALLMCAQAPLPTTVLGHGFVHGPDGRKMSKSLDNVVDPYAVLANFPVDSFRWFLMRETTFGGDVTFSETALALRHNAELADTFGNCVHRSLSLCAKYCGGKVPDATADAVLDVGALREATAAAFASHQIEVAAAQALGALNAANKYITDTEPWHLKADDPKRLVVVRTILECIYAAAHFLAPYLVHTAPKVFAMLNTAPVPIAKLSATLTNLQPGTQTAAGEILYEKVATAEALAKQAADAEAKKAAEAKKREADAKRAGAPPQSDLSKMDFRVGVIIDVKRHESADALYVERVDVGEAAPRQVVSGLVKHIPIEQMANRRVVVLANLKPSALRDVESQAMVLCGKAADGSKMELVEPPEGVPPGERVVCAGHEEAPEQQLNPKKKIWEKLVQPTLNTSSDCVVRAGELPFMTSRGPCTVKTIAGGMVA